MSKIELDLEKVEDGYYPIQFFMDNGMEVIDSEREIPIDVIRRIKTEYLLNQKEDGNHAAAFAQM